MYINITKYKLMFAFIAAQLCVFTVDPVYRVGLNRQELATDYQYRMNELNAKIASSCNQLSTIKEYCDEVMRLHQGAEDTLSLNLKSQNINATKAALNHALLCSSDTTIKEYLGQICGILESHAENLGYNYQYRMNELNAKIASSCGKLSTIKKYCDEVMRLHQGAEDTLSLNLRLQNINATMMSLQHAHSYSSDTTIKEYLGQICGKLNADEQNIHRQYADRMNELNAKIASSCNQLSTIKEYCDEVTRLHQEIQNVVNVTLTCKLNNLCITMEVLQQRLSGESDTTIKEYLEQICGKLQNKIANLNAFRSY